MSDTIITGIGVLFFGCLIWAYFIPTMIALVKKHHNTGAIFILNLLLGWTMIGWIAALIWSCTNPTPQTIIVHAPPPEPPR